MRDPQVVAAQANAIDWRRIGSVVTLAALSGASWMAIVQALELIL